MNRLLLVCVLPLLVACPVPAGVFGQKEGQKTGGVEAKYLNMTRPEYCFYLTQKMRDAYVAENISSYMSYVSRSFRGGYSVLQNGVENDFRNFDFLREDMWLDRGTLAENNDVYLDFHWTLQYSARGTGQISTMNGKSTAQFSEETEDYRMVDLRGDKPFALTTETVGSPDLTVKVISALLMDGPAAKVTMIVSNIGKAASPDSSVFVKVILEGNPATKTDPVGGLGPGQSSTIVVIVPIPTVPFASVTATIDPNNQIAEMNENNNSHTFP